jgi:TadE-like protein
MRTRINYGLGTRIGFVLKALWKESQGAQIVEFAISLPLLAALFVGTYDFGQAFNVKQKLVAATREGARFAANQSTSDLTVAQSQQTPCLPASICAVRAAQPSPVDLDIYCYRMCCRKFCSDHQSWLYL